MNKDSKKRASESTSSKNEQSVSLERLNYLRKLESKYVNQANYYRSELERVRGIIQEVEISLETSQMVMF